MYIYIYIYTHLHIHLHICIYGELVELFSKLLNVSTYYKILEWMRSVLNPVLYETAPAI